MQWRQRGTLVAQITWLAELSEEGVPCPTGGNGLLVSSLGFTVADAKRDLTLTLIPGLKDR